ncbi:MAG: FG-GAP-like repeat-containing protein, partial [Magnetococcus sp. WYHC-3]
ATRTLTGTPAGGDTGVLNLRINASDNAGAQASDDFTLTVSAGNHAPVVDQGVSAQSATENQPLSLTLPANAFADADGDPLSYSLTRADGSALPGWLSFDAATRTLTGTPGDADAGTLALRLAAADPSGASAAVVFQLVVAAVNDAPILEPALRLLETLQEGTTQPAGARVADLLSGLVSDADAGDDFGMALTAADDSHGVWQYSLDQGNTWSDVTPPVAGYALLLGADDATRLRFVPDAGFSGDADMQFRAWDHSAGSVGDYAEVTSTGGTSPFSAASASARVSVGAVDDAPDLLDTRLTFAATEQNFGNANSQGVILADMDRDGDLDAMVHVYQGMFQLWSNDGQAHFTRSDPGIDGYSARDFSLGDLDGDGDLDALVVNSASWPSIYLNNGQNSFTDTQQRFGFSNSRAVALGDVDGDGDLDAFVANSGANKVLLNDGHGVMSDSGQSLGNKLSRDVALGDVDGDGDLDAVVGNWTTGNELWLNNGSGTFTDSGQNLGRYGTLSVNLGDMDGDGDLDLYLGNYGSTIPNANKIWLNDGQGHFTNTLASLGEESTNDGQLADLDGDGDLDIYDANLGGDGVWLNDGNGHVRQADAPLDSSDSYAVASGDLNGDGLLDLWVARPGAADTVLLNTSAPGGTAQPFYYSEGDGVVSLLPRVLVNDGDTPLIDGVRVTVSASFLADANRLDITAMHGIAATWDAQAGTLTLSGSATLAQYQEMLRTLAFENTSANPIATTHTVTLTALADGAEGTPLTLDIHVIPVNDAPVVSEAPTPLVTFDPGPALGSADSHALVLGDFDGDGDQDLFVGSETGGSRIWLRQADGSLADSGQSLAAGVSTWHAAAGDLDGDGDLDLALANYGQANTLLFNNGSGQFSNGGTLGSNVDLSTALALGDVDGDGDLDALVSNDTQASMVWINAGNGSYTAGQTLATGAFSSVVMGDFNEDGHLDAFMGAWGAGNRVLLGDGTGQFTQTSQSLGIASFTSGAALADLNGDGHVDIYETNWFGGDKVWLGDGSGQFVSNNQLLGQSNSQGVALHDVDGDGDLDAYVGVAGADNQLWYNTGSGLFYDSTLSLGSGGQAVVVTDLDADGTGDPLFGSNSGVTSQINDTTYQTGLPRGYPEGAGERVVNENLLLTDSDDTLLEGARAKLYNYQSGEDRLDFTSTGSISGTWNATTGILTLTGQATMAEYQQALRTITYENTSQTPSTLQRTVGITVSDGDADSAEMYTYIFPQDNPATTAAANPWMPEDPALFSLEDAAAPEDPALFSLEDAAATEIAERSTTAAEVDLADVGRQALSEAELDLSSLLEGAATLLADNDAEAEILDLSESWVVGAASASDSAPSAMDSLSGFETPMDMGSLLALAGQDLVEQMLQPAPSVG